MAIIGGTQVNIGIGIEATPGTPVSATTYPKWTEFSLQAISEKAMFNSHRGVRNTASDSTIRRKHSGGSLAVIPNSDIAPYLFGLALGSVSSSAIADSAYTHTVAVQNANASMKTGTFIAEQGGIVIERFANVVANSLALEVSDSYANLTVDLIGGFPDTGALTESYAQESEFAYHEMTAKFGTTVTLAAAASATPLKSFTFYYFIKMFIKFPHNELPLWLCKFHHNTAWDFTAGFLRLVILEIWCFVKNDSKVFSSPFLEIIFHVSCINKNTPATPCLACHSRR